VQIPLAQWSGPMSARLFFVILWHADKKKRFRASPKLLARAPKAVADGVYGASTRIRKTKLVGSGRLEFMMSKF